MNTETIAHCMTLSFADTPFPAVVEKLIGAGVRAYTADLMLLRNTYYGAGGDTADEPLPLDRHPIVADVFNSAGVAASVRAIQRGELGYAEFLRRIMADGCAHYCVYIGGRKVVYFGRDGDSHTEHFPTRTS